MDTFFSKKESEEEKPLINKAPKIEVKGLYNFLFLIGIVLSVLMSGIINAVEVKFLGIHLTIQDLLRDNLMILMGLLSLYFTPKKVRKEN